MNKYLVIIIPKANIENARISFDDFFEVNLKRNDWNYSVDTKENYKDAEENLYIVACFNEEQFKNGFSQELQIEVNAHNPSFKSFGILATVTETPKEWLTSQNLIPIEIEI